MRVRVRAAFYRIDAVFRAASSGWKSSFAAAQDFGSRLPLCSRLLSASTSAPKNGGLRMTEAEWLLLAFTK
jgi:hypothetical protein